MSTSRRLRARRSEHGFTLSELLVVILVIGIIAAIAVPQFLNQRQRAYDSTTKSDLTNTATALHGEFAKQTNSVDPATWVEGVAQGDATGKAKFSYVVGRGTSSETLPGDDTFLSEGTVVALGGTADDFTVCGYNPNGLEYRDPDTSLVWDSKQGKPREAQANDDCVAVAKGQGPPTSGDDEEEPGTPGDDPLPPIAAIGTPTVNYYDSYWNPYITYPITVDPAEGQTITDLGTITLTLDGELICPDVRFDNEGQALIGITPSHVIPAGLLEVRSNGLAIGWTDFSEYEALGHTAAPPSVVNRARSELATVLEWMDTYAQGARHVDVRVYPGSMEVSDDMYLLTEGIDDLRSLRWDGGTIIMVNPDRGSAAVIYESEVGEIRVALAVGSEQPTADIDCLNVGMAN